jgi:hypothetical protein
MRKLSPKKAEWYREVKTAELGQDGTRAQALGHYPLCLSVEGSLPVEGRIMSGTIRTPVLMIQHGGQRWKDQREKE